MEQPIPYGFLSNGLAASRIREIDWSRTAIGPIETWPVHLKSILGTMMRSAQAMLLLVGPDLIQFYNDAYITNCGNRHPEQMGAPTAQTWPEVIDGLSAKFASVFNDGTPSTQVDTLLMIERGGRLLRTYWTYGLTPFVDAEGRVDGILIVPVETTQRVLAAHRQQCLEAISAALADATSAADVLNITAEAFASSCRNTTTMRGSKTPRSEFRPSGCQSAAPQTHAAPTLAEVAELADWVNADGARFAQMLAGSDVHAPEQFIVPLPASQASDLMRFITFNIDPSILLDEPHCRFLRQVTEQIAQASDRLETAVSRKTITNERNELLMQAPVGTAVMTGPRLVFTLANDIYCRLAGRNDLIGKTYEEAFPELVGTDIPALLHDIYARGVAYSSPETLVPLARDGSDQISDCYFRFTIQPLRTFEGDVYALLAVATDLTDQVVERLAVDKAHEARHDELEANARRLEDIVHARTLSLQELNDEMLCTNESLRQALEFNHNVTEMMPGRIAYCDADLICRFANKSFCEWVGRAPEDVIGRSGLELFPPEAIARVRHHIDAVMAGELQRFETKGLKPDGGVIYNQLHYVPEKTGPVDRRGFYLMSVDITRLKEAELNLQELNADLARSRDEAQAANRAKSAFLANMSHEIRTPLNAILGMTHILSRRIEDRSHLDKLGKVDVAAKHLLGLISDVLDLSKIEAGKLTLESRDFAVSDAVQRAIGMVSETASDKGLTLATDIASLPKTLRGDSLRLSQILINLLSNAVKFTSSGSVTLRARMVDETGSQRLLRFEVQDTGIGIDERNRAGLFGAFEQADQSITRRHGGTGLGLALSRQLARAMGGDAGFESVLGVGSLFWFTASLEAGDRAVGRAANDSWAPGKNVALPAMQILEYEARLRDSYAGLRILLAEDNPVNQEVAVGLLENVGLKVSTAIDGVSAIEMVTSEPFDLVLMDVQMPSIGGLDATRAIRARLFDVPIVAMTANAFVEDRAACLEAGMNDHLAKPVEPLALYKILIRWLPLVDGSADPIPARPTVG